MSGAQDMTLFQASATNGNELAQAGAAASAQHEIQSAIIIAKKFPRNEELCFQKLMRACTRPSFAEGAVYNFPRGGHDVTGPSVNLAREAARIWGNLEYGLMIARDDDDSMLIRGLGWDKETNVRIFHEDTFRKLIQRKVKGGKTAETEWLVPDERDLRELVNRRGAILVRNSILQLLPKDLIEDALYQCSKTLEKRAEEDPDSTQKRLLVDFNSVNVSVEQIEQKLGHRLSQASPKELAELRGICNSIINGNSTWAEYVKGPEPKPFTPEQAANKAKLEEGQRALKETQAQPVQKSQAEPPLSGQSEDVRFNRFSTRLREAESVAQIATVMNEALNGQDSLLATELRQSITAIKDECLAKMRKRKS